MESAPNDICIAHVHIRAHRVIVEVKDGRIIATPIAWYPRLAAATPGQRKKWRIVGDGYGVRWPDIDEDLSVEGMLKGIPATTRAKRRKD